MEADIVPSAEVADSDHVSKGAAARIKALDQLTSSTLRKSQVINKVSDVVRELVENALDAGATTIQVYLDKYGKEKIEVRDNGAGLDPEDVKLIFRGGHTSKLSDTANLSRGNYLGFRGEALSAMCAVGNVSVITKRANQSAATKYKFDPLGGIISESKIAHGDGTTVTLEKLFDSIPVRRQRLENMMVGANELKEIESYLKGAGIANPKSHISLNHNSSLVWAKPSVQTIEQALIAVLGHSIAKRLQKNGPIKIENECHPAENSSESSIELYLPLKPVDMRTMSYTSNKMTMIFCNQKRVYIREYERLIHRYITANVERPQPADQRRFPVSLLCISVPANEADFNLDMDKTKVLLVHKEKIRDAIENTLMQFYGMDLRTTDDEVEAEKSAQAPSHHSDESITVSINSGEDINKTCKSSSLSTKISRDSSIKSFLQDMPSTSRAFSKSPIKQVNTEPVSVEFPVSKSAFDVPQTRTETNVTRNLTRNVVANFEISVDSQLFDIEDPTAKPKDHGTSDKLPSPLSEDKMEKGQDVDDKLKNWLYGRMVDKFGEVIENVNVVPIFEDSSKKDNESVKFRAALTAGVSNSSFNKNAGIQSSSYPHTNTMGPPMKKLRNDSERILAPSPLGSSNVPRQRQVTLDSLLNWSAPIGNFSQAASNAVVGVRIPLTPMRAEAPSLQVPQLSRPRPQESVQSKVTPQVEHPSLVTTSQRWPCNLYDTSSTRLTPQIHKRVPGDVCDGQLYYAQTYDSIGVFSPKNMVEYFPRESRECWTSSCAPVADSPTERALLSTENVSKMFQKYLESSEINEAPSSEKIFYTISKIRDLGT